MKYLVANWKSHKTSADAYRWFDGLRGFETLQDVEIVVCPSVSYLKQLKDYAEEKKLAVKLGAQNVSPFPFGAYTGAVAVEMIEENENGAFFVAGIRKMAVLDAEGRKLQEAASPLAKVPDARISAVASTKGDHYICGGMRTYTVYRIDAALKTSKLIIKGLRPCFTECEVVGHDGAIYVASNTPEKVRKYDREGKLLALSDEHVLAQFPRCAAGESVWPVRPSFGQERDAGVGAQGADVASNPKAAAEAAVTAGTRS